MGLAGLGALLFMLLSLIAQSPQLMRRLGLSRLRLELRSRAFTGYAFALLLLAMAFYLSGVPLGGQSSPTSVNQQDIGSSLNETQVVDSSTLEDLPTTANSLAVTAITPETGAFTGPPEPITPTPEAQLTRVEPEITITQVVTNQPPSEEINEPGLEPSEIPTVANTSTATPTPSPTQSPTPSMTPTRIQGATTTLSTSGSTIWLKRSPGGQNVALVRDGDQVILMAGHANQAGMMWRQIQTLDGIVGWIREEYLQTIDESS